MTPRSAAVSRAAGAAAIFGEVLFDHFPDGSRALGGAPFNVAWHLQALGAHPVLVTRVGDDAAGEQVRATMERWEMSTEGVQRDPTHPTGEVRVRLRDGDPSYEILDDQAYDHIRAEALTTIDFSASALVYHGTLALRRTGAAGALTALLEHSGAPVFMDVNLRAPWWDPDTVARWLDHARWVKLNRDELRRLSGDERGDIADTAAGMVERHGLEFMVVTLGEDGAVLVDDTGERIESAAVRVPRLIDTVGAGDAFAAVLILALLRGWRRETALDRAQQLAARVIGRRGATTEDGSLYRPFIDAWELTTS